MNDEPKKIHDFELSGLGKAPFRFLGYETKLFTPHPGAPSKPGGTCDRCWTAITICFQFESADGKRFKVGSTCVEKFGRTYDVVTPVKAALRKINRMKRRAREEVKITWLKANLNKARAVLQSRPHPQKWASDKGKTAWDSAIWMILHAGNAGKIKLASQIKIALGG